MKRITTFLLALIMVLSLCACGKTAEPEVTPEPEKLAFNDDPEAITAASASVVMISVYDKSDELIATGSGFPAFEDGIIITNAHVIEGGDHFEANTENGMYFKLDSIVAVDSERDIAILRTEANPGFDLLTIGSTTGLLKGEKVVAIGSPLGLINTVSEGMYSNVRNEDGQNYLQFTAEISHGSSGGALFNNAGEVIGVTSGSYIDGENLNLAVPIEVVVDVWEHKDEHPEIQELDVYTISEYYSIVAGNLENMVDSELIIEGYVSTKYAYGSNNQACWLIIVSNPDYEKNNDLNYIPNVTTSYHHARFFNEKNEVESSGIGVFFSIDRNEFNKVQTGDYIKATVIVEYYPYLTNYHDCNYYISGKSVEVINNP